MIGESHRKNRSSTAGTLIVLLGLCVMVAGCAPLRLVNVVDRAPVDVVCAPPKGLGPWGVRGQLLALIELRTRFRKASDKDRKEELFSTATTRMHSLVSMLYREASPSQPTSESLDRIGSVLAAYWLGENERAERETEQLSESEVQILKGLPEWAAGSGFLKRPAGEELYRFFNNVCSAIRASTEKDTEAQQLEPARSE